MRYLLLFTFFFHCLISSSGAQDITVSDDFEGNGTINTWYGDDCGINTSLANPFSSAINNSNTVLEYRDTGGQYANIGFDVANKFDLSSQSTFSIKVYVPASGLSGSQPNQVSLKLQNRDLAQPWSTQSEIVKSLTLYEWQTITFDFSSDEYINLDANSLPPTDRTDFNRVLFQFNGENNNDQVLAYIDDMSYSGTIPAPPEPPVYDNLVWSDEFEVDGPIDSEKWFHQTKLPQGGSWYNGEIQHYTDRTDNSYVEDGVLKIVAKKEAYTDQGYTKQYTSARLNSKYAFTYGKVEIRAKLPIGIGTWPAIWMLGKNISEDGAYWYNEGFGTTPWPACGEIDIMEHWGKDQNNVTSATHTPSSFGNTINKGSRYIETASTAFHIYTLEWTPDKLVFSIDDIDHLTYNPTNKNADTWPFDAEQYILLNIAIEPQIESSYTSSAMEIDYIRIYKEGPEPVLATTEGISRKAYPVPFTNKITIQLEKASNQQIMLKIYSNDGKLLQSEQIKVYNNKITVNDLGHLQNGLYYFKFEINHQPYSIKVIKN
jgi:beta-glucanase (GH16 family)